MDVPGCAVGRIGPGGSWIGFAPTLDDGYALVVGTASGSRSGPAERDDLLSLAVAYFEDGLNDPPEELAATHGDIGALVRHVAEHETDPVRRRLLDEAVDAVDDGLAADVVIARLTRILADGTDPIARLTRRAADLSGG